MHIGLTISPNRPTEKPGFPTRKMRLLVETLSRQGHYLCTEIALYKKMD
jgi:hypothetical protein